MLQVANATPRGAPEPAEMKRQWSSSALKNSDTILIHATARSITYAFSAVPCSSLAREALCTGEITDNGGFRKGAISRAVLRAIRKLA